MKQVAKVLLAAVTAVTVAAPIPAAPPAGAAAAAAGKAPVHHSASRVRGVPTFANSTLADIGTFDDPIVREAAVEGLGRYNGAVVAVNPNTGRVLTVVNQKVAFGDGFIPCSTIKPTIAVAVVGLKFLPPDGAESEPLRLPNEPHVGLLVVQGHTVRRSRRTVFCTHCYPPAFPEPVLEWLGEDLPASVG